MNQPLCALIGFVLLVIGAGYILAWKEPKDGPFHRPYHSDAYEHHGSE